MAKLPDDVIRQVTVIDDMARELERLAKHIHFMQTVTPDVADRIKLCSDNINLAYTKLVGLL